MKKNKGLSFLIVLATASLSACGGSESRPSESSPISIAGAGSGDFSGMVLKDIHALNFSNGSAEINFDGQSDALLLVSSTSQAAGDIILQADRVGMAALADTTPLAGLQLAADAEDNEEPSSLFHQYLREMETAMRESGEYSPVKEDLQTGLAINAADSDRRVRGLPEVGDEKPFRVISTMSSITTYADVTGELRMATDNLYVYVDQSVHDHISDKDIATLAHNFEAVALLRERAIMGAESDINFDGHISILMTCVVNRMAGTGGIVTGFFFPGDMYQRSGANPASNAQEIFYTLVPDPNGDCGTPIGSSFAINNILPGVLAHEYQHMNSFNRHVLQNGGSTEASWLNECLSHLWEDLAGYGNENPSRVKLFLSQPSKVPLIPPTSPTLAERGACYAFLRYLYEQNPDGDAFLSRLYSSDQTGLSNLEEAYQGTPDFDEFSEFVARWAIALSVSGSGLTSDPRYNYRDRSVDAETGNKTGLCIRCEAQDGRGTVLNGPAIASLATIPNASILKGTATQFYRATNPSGAISMNGGSSGSLEGTLITLQKE